MVLLNPQIFWSQPLCGTPDGGGSSGANELPGPCTFQYWAAAETNDCHDYRRYAPIVPAYVPIKNVMLVFHVFQMDDGSHNFQNTPNDIALMDVVLDAVNGIYGNLDVQTPLPLVNCPSVPITDSRIRFFRSPQIFFHQDDDAWAMNNAGTCGFWNLYVEDNPNMPANLRDEAIHVFIARGSTAGCGTGGNPIGGLSNGAPAGIDKYVVEYKWYQCCVENGDLWQLGNGAAWNLAHELGHALGLRHSWLDEFCDTPGGQGTSTNVMDYDAFHALTQYQLGKMHKLLAGECLGTNCGDTWKTDHTDYYNLMPTPIEIFPGEVITWDVDRKLNTDVIVRTGGELIITCRVGMPQNGRIIVQRGARLRVEGGHLTHNSTFWPYCATGKWKGIRVAGNGAVTHTEAMRQPAYDQQDTDPGIVLLTNSVIESAKDAVATQADEIGWPDMQNYWNGLIYANHTTFRNNLRSAEFMRYDKKNWGGFVNGCVFEDIDGTANYGVTQWAVRGLVFDQCTFTNLNKEAIGGWDASPIVTRCTFNGIKHANELLATMNLSADIFIGNADPDFGNTYNNNEVGINTGTINSLKVWNNTFNNGTFGMYLNGLGSGEIVRNHFLLNNSIGIQLENTGIFSQQLRCNEYDNFIGIEAKGDNFGLEFSREQFSTNHDVLYTHVGDPVTGAVITPGVMNDQGASNEAVWNYFSNGPENVQHINTTGTTVQFTYYFPQLLPDPRLRPDCNLDNLLTCAPSTFPNDYHDDGTQGGDGDCPPFIAQPPGGSENEECATEECLSSLKTQIAAIEYQISQGINVAENQHTLNLLNRDKAAILSALVNNWLAVENYAAIESTLGLETNSSAKRSLVSLDLLRSQYSQATQKLNVSY